MMLLVPRRVSGGGQAGETRVETVRKLRRGGSTSSKKRSRSQVWTRSTVRRMTHGSDSSEGGDDAMVAGWWWSLALLFELDSEKGREGKGRDRTGGDFRSREGTPGGQLI